MLENWQKQWNMKVTIIPNVIGAFGTVSKGLLKGLDDLEVGGREETIQTTSLLRTARILRRVLRLDVTQTPVKNHQLKLMGKTLNNNNNSIRTLGEKKNYKYLGILKTDTIKQVAMKEKIRKVYLRRAENFSKANSV